MNRMRAALPAALLGCLLFGATIVLYLPVWSYPFLDFDDRDMVMNNPLVRNGLIWGDLPKNLVGFYEGHWIPLTWFSFFLERLLAGERPGIFHGTNALLHAGCVLLLFWLVRRLTGTLWPAALMAALFAVHPLHVESVVWIAERKDVLSMIFGLAALHAYVGWVRRPGRARYLGVMACFVLSLIAKPMFAILPLLLLLLDFWPLGRCRATTKTALIREKLPLIAISLAFGVLSIAAQRPMFSTLELMSLATRTSYALVAPLFYLWKLVWPSGLAFMYIMKPQPYPAWIVVLAPCLIAAGIWWAARVRERHPWALVGWLWYLVVLAPVSGIAQAGMTIVADRLVYVPALGIYLLFVWGGGALLAGRRSRELAAVVAAVVIVATLAVFCRRQIGFWRDKQTLFERALDVSPDHWAPWTHLVEGWIDQGNLEMALAVARNAHLKHPGVGGNTFNLGLVLDMLGRYEEARKYYLQALWLGFEKVDVYAALGAIERRLDGPEASLGSLLHARKLDPKFPGVSYNLGVAMVMLERKAEAVKYFREAVELAPRNYRMVFNLGRALLDTGSVDEAAVRFTEVVKLKPDFAAAYGLLGLARETQGRRAAAAAAFRAALAIDPSDAQAREGLARVEGSAGR